MCVTATLLAAQGSTTGARNYAYSMSRILVGTTSWTEKTLVESGRFYPPDVHTAEERLRFYASQFPVVEVDSSY